MMVFVFAIFKMTFFATSFANVPLLMSTAKVDGNEDEKELKEAPEDDAADDHRDERTDEPPNVVVDEITANVLATAKLF